MNREFDTPVGYTHVYVAPLPDREVGEPLGITLRDEEIARITNDQLRREKYYAFRLLELAARESLGLTLEQLSLTKENTGRWLSPICDISISHSSGALAVAISDGRVGVDVEGTRTTISPRFPRRSLTPKEMDEFLSLPEEYKNRFLITAWSGKEAVFKAQCKESFIPSTIDTMTPSAPSEALEGYQLLSRPLAIGGGDIVLSLCCSADCDPVYHIGVTL